MQHDAIHTDPATAVPDDLRRHHLRGLCRRWLEFALEYIGNAEEEANALAHRTVEGTVDHTVARAVAVRCGVAREQLRTAADVLGGEK